MLGTIILSISRNERRYLSVVLSVNFLVTLSYTFENVVEILTGRKFDISFLLEVPLWEWRKPANFSIVWKNAF